jgi:phosphatidylinositol alpha-1,6-mannosyltransferase
VLKIILLSDKYPPDPGGLAVSVQRLAQQLKQAGHDVRVIAPTNEAAGSRTFVAGVEVQRLPRRRRLDETLAAWFDFLRAELQARPADIVHSYFVNALAFAGVYVARTVGIPAVVSARGNDLDRAVFDPAKAPHILYALQHADAITANARDLARKAQALTHTRWVVLIPNGVDTAYFQAPPRDTRLVQSLGLTDRAVIGFVGEARSKKGLASLLIAYRMLAQQHSLALLLVGGVRRDDQELLKVFQKQCPTLPLVVVPYLPTDQLPAYYSLLDMLVLPSLHDGLPNALLEGMACERAIVGSTVGGIPDAITDGENGRLIPPGDAEALAHAVDELLADAKLRRRFGHCARETVQRDFTLEQELKKNLALYRQLLNDR